MIVKLETARGWARNKSLAERFHRSYMPITESGCWIWIAKTGGGPRKDRGVINDGNGHKYRAAHRVSWELHNGPIHSGLLVCHRCDVSACVNPHHLFLGTQKDNLRDMVSKGRHGNRLLTDKIAAKIRASSERPKILAARYGVCQGTIYNVLANICYAPEQLLELVNKAIEAK
jgi:hypothetical protein